MKWANFIGLLIIFVSCVPPVGKDVMLIKKDYSGTVLIVFNGSKPQNDRPDKTNTYQIDSTGVLVRQPYNDRKVSAYAFCYYDDNGKLDTLPYVSPLEYNNNYEKYNTDDRIAVSFMEDGSYYDSKRVKQTYVSFVVGKLKDLDSLVELRDKFVMKNLNK